MLQNKFLRHVTKQDLLLEYQQKNNIWGKLEEFNQDKTAEVILLVL